MVTSTRLKSVDITELAMLPKSILVNSNNIKQGCAIFFNGGPNTNKHNILRAAPSNRIIFYRISKTILPAIKLKLQ